MKIVFIGTLEFSKKALHKLVEINAQLVGVCTKEKSSFNSEIAQHPFPRSERNLRALATLRGSTCGCEYAESFVLLKEIG